MVPTFLFDKDFDTGIKTKQFSFWCHPVMSYVVMMIHPVFLLLSIAIHATSENDQSRGSKHNFARLFDTLLKLPKRSGLRGLDPSQWNSEIHNLDDRQLHWNTNPSVQSSIVPLDETLETPFLFSFGRQNSGCTCKAIVLVEEGFCITTCSTAETQCGQTCTRTITFSGYTKFGELPIYRQSSQIDEKACEKLEIDCITSSLLSMASSSSAIAATASVVANIALSAGIAAGIAALAFAAKEKDMQNNGNNYYETEDPYGTEAQYSQAYAKRYARRLFTQVGDDSGSDDFNAQTDNKRAKNPLTEEASVEGSIHAIDETSDVPNFLRAGRQSGCGCDPFTCFDQACTTECLSLSQLCNGRLCTLTTSVSTFLYLAVFTSFSAVNTKDCDTLENACSVSSAMSSAIAAAYARSNAIALNAGIAGVLSAGLAGGNIAVMAVSNNQQTDNNVNNQQIRDNSNNQVPQPGNQTPTNDLPSPVPGSDFPDDGSGTNSIQFDDGKSHPLLTRGPCNGTNFWVTVNPVTLKGKCTPKLCEDKRVFVGRTGLCHDINDPLECQGGRRLYYTAYGDPICDCPIGKYPFPNPKDNCVALFSRGPCPAGQVMTISQGGRLFCTPDECPVINGENDSLQQLVPNDKGDCFALGSVGPCSAPQLLGYDIFERQLECVNITDPSSPYFPLSSQEGGLIDRIMLEAFMSYQFHPDDNDLHFGLSQQAKRGIIKRKIQRQDANTAGIFQLPSSLPYPLLQPCRTGARQGENFKCTNPLISDSSATGQTLPPVNPNFSCPDSTFLQATGQCVDDSRATSCGPSFRFNEATGQCRSVF
ncbi:uncharacterized protein LOC116919237 isoform X1 [Daphnia magna]|uniref:uncharacterized protein LOC116919237 isoform X1 n=1 Tax=Daphnia magna TaxID=35525 RepID=UPI001E1BC746|nr:uncharacterized protein LOC116919237 isoform X1 [Daphnia magna]